MKLKNPFFNKKSSLLLSKIIETINSKDTNNKKINIKINDIKEINEANKNEITFLHSSKYLQAANTTKASFCITNLNLQKFLPKECKPIIVKNILLSVAKVTELFYPNAINDHFDNTVKIINKTKFKKIIKYGNNVLIGKNVKIGKNSTIGHNSIIEKNVIIGKNCSIGSNVIIRNTIIGSNVSILDGSIIGKKGFGFFPNLKQNIRYPHIGLVIINDNSEIGCNCTIDRGSLSNTEIGKNTFLDNQIHIAHNVKIGNNCMIAGQVGFAGSSTIGNNVMIGGQAGISGHLNIGINVQIAGGSGVVSDISENLKVMGYPAKNIKLFLKKNKRDE